MEGGGGGVEMGGRRAGGGGGDGKKRGVRYKLLNVSLHTHTCSSRLVTMVTRGFIHLEVKLLTRTITDT